MENILDETRFIMKKYNIRANKSLGQNFLINSEVVKTKNDTEAFKIEHTIIELADEKYVMNRIEGGRPDNFEGLICKIF